MVKKICDIYEVCAKLRHWQAHLRSRQSPSSLELGHALYAVVVGPLVQGREEVQYIHSFVDSVTRMRDVMALRTINSEILMKAMCRWLTNHGVLKVLMTDNLAYYTSIELDNWCQEVNVKHMFIAS